MLSISILKNVYDINRRINSNMIFSFCDIDMHVAHSS